MHSRYKPGQSGNPKGRPRGSKNKSTILREILSQKVTVHQNGKTLKMNKLTVIMMTLVNKALAGDLRAISTLRPMIESMESASEATARLGAELSIDDREILKDYVGRAKNTPQFTAQ